MALAVIKLLQISKDVLLGDVPRWISCTVTLLSLEAGEERFDHRIVEAVPLSACMLGVGPDAADRPFDRWQTPRMSWDRRVRPSRPEARTSA